MSAQPLLCESLNLDFGPSQSIFSCLFFKLSNKGLNCCVVLTEIAHRQNCTLLDMWIVSIPLHTARSGLSSHCSLAACMH